MRHFGKPTPGEYNSQVLTIQSSYKWDIIRHGG